MMSLEKLGVSVQRRFLTSSSSINGIEVSGKQSTELMLTLPRATSVKASFAREGLGRKLIKVFKRELQTGDRAFDDAIYIATDTADATRALLADDRVRAAIAATVMSGGRIEIDESTVTAQIDGHTEGEDAHVVRVVEALLSA
jgi:hypothetical protein